MNNLNDSFQDLQTSMEQLNFVAANSLIGKKVTGTDLEGKSHTGVAERVTVENNYVYLIVDKAKIPVFNVTNVEEVSSKTVS